MEKLINAYKAQTDATKKLKAAQRVINNLRRHPFCGCLLMPGEADVIEECVALVKGVQFQAYGDAGNA